MTQARVFQQFEIRPEERLLLVSGQAVGIGARAFDVLLALVDRSQRVVSKAELLDLAWPGVVVEENNLTVQISTLRRVLGHETIVTVTGRGYRLKVVPVDAPALAEPEPAAVDDTVTRLQRRLAVIVQAEVVGWSRLVARDPTRAAATWKRIRVDLIERSLPHFGGRAIELTAERLQLEFVSAVEAVAWAVELQETLAERRQAADPAENAAFHLRIGIAVDDVIVDDGKLVGDGVNVAADLQLSAVHDEILTTQKVCDFVAHKIPVSFDPLGQRVMQKSQRPVHVLRVVTGSRRHAVSALRPAGVRVASLAVLPFSTEGPPTDAYFGEGVTEEIIATLSLNRALFVIAHSSTLRYRGNELNPADVAAELGVRYLVTGRVRRAGSQVRIHVSLIHAADQRVIWQQPFDGVVEDLFTFQTEIAAKVAAAAAPQVQDEEVAQARQRPTDSHDAYDCVLRALACMVKLGSPEFDTAGHLLLRAVELDPGYAQAHAHLAWWYSLRQFDGLASTDGQEGRLGLEHALQSVRLDSRDAWVLSVAGYMLSLQKQHDEALDLFDRALKLNPSCAAAWARSAATLCYVGRAEEALERLDRAMRLSPFDQHLFWHLTICGGASFVARRYDESAGWLGKALRLNPSFNGARRLQIAALVRTGELAEARALAEQFLVDCPSFSVQEFGRWSPMQRPHLDDLLSALRQAGLPD
ncbi:TolB-like protein/DNA-binding winged helix-turn-helix (wHTH) protein [Pelomonas saccharophila]|uniref:TolB-like protein/DNA-binding winged helix-turn-helix (WHTH) protein n=1 Tax=Roseateles saccharophilus TaxID=304 RepID=A0ABU1YN04_ROSSA|nr:winged helix-turn-helix domain-containing protein [Roseateles saccharophilus]MDR7269381.1 TolB-like protein/DNA-binding winged helix-turn-helix (wHTH) protein [Roseateles saccharophilus]